MNEPSSLLEELSEEALLRLEEVCCRFEKSWLADQRPRLEDFLNTADRGGRFALLRELLRLELHYRKKAGEAPSPRDYQQRFPDAGSLLQEFFPRSVPAGKEQPPGKSLETDRNLLFGVLALQVDLIDNEQFAQACALWAADKGRSLAEVLVAQGWLTPDDRADVEKLLRRKLKKFGGDVQASLAEAVDGGAAALAEIKDAEVQASLAAVGFCDPERTTDQYSATGARYRILRPHAEGGLGKVFVAQDAELHREVALKEIKKEHAAQEISRARFLLEAEITGGLEHPGIVPVYGLGSYADGRPYYAMRFIKGDNLKAAIERFHAQPPLRFDSLEFRQLLSRFVDVCQAIAYAHSRGVLHRDLKPGNIMLGKFGETLVVDWGLAKVVGRESEEQRAGQEELTLRPSGSGVVETVAGTAVGTPAFMSPEQAAGKLTDLGPATDVYSLGTTLYVLLTNRPPFQGKVEEVLQQVQRGSWVRPRQIKAEVPPALEAICCQAMALRPEDRYASAQALAEEVEGWLADEPVKAYPEPAGARLRRWMRKHPRRVTAVAVLLVMAVVGLAAGTVLVEWARREARDNLKLAENLTNYYLTEVSDEVLLNEPGMQPLRQSLLLNVLEQFLKHLEKRPEDPQARQHIAEAKRQLGELYVRTGREDLARPLLDQAVELSEELLRQARVAPERQASLAHAYLARAQLQVQSGQPGEGRREVDRGIELLEKLWAGDRENPRYLHLLTRSYELRGTADSHLDDTEASCTDNQKALDIGELMFRAMFGVRGDRFARHTLGTAAPGQDSRSSSFPNANLLLARICTQQGILLNMAGKNAEATRALQEAIFIYQWLLERNPRPGQFRHGLALALLHASDVQVDLGWPARAEAELRATLERTEQLVRADPSVPEYAAIRLLAAGSLGKSLFRRGRTAAATGLLRETARLGEDVLGGPGKSWRLRAQYARFLHVLGCLEQDTGNLDLALGACQRASDRLAQARQEAPGNRLLHADGLANREALAQLRFLKGDLTLDGWITEQRQVLAQRRDLARQGPSSPRFQAEVAGSAAVLSDLLLRARRPAEALACVNEVLPAQEKLVQQEQDRARTVADDPGKVDLHRFRITERWKPTLPPLVPEASQPRRQWAGLLAREAAALAQVGRSGEAIEVVRQAVGLAEGLVQGDRQLRCPPASPVAVWSFLAEELCRQEPCYLYDLACHLALASTLPGHEALGDPAGRAVQALREYVASGFDNPHRLGADPALEPVRQRQDFQGLLRELEVRARAGQGAAAPVR